ncbi:diguanylate phosphodiesterase [Trinickia symbiotica]|uniref:Diguanylate phosphodiesterase n=1 Tax=Trinickia symbiotica TaxID=863227 RepID=A0A2T3Y167_9BURK|nr:EAL domain-containing protein [Trinickia symbiotica]PTB22514.1 diguanylate phosphodiesterase [Trinickia symbiotica]
MVSWANEHLLRGIERFGSVHTFMTTDSGRRFAARWHRVQTGVRASIDLIRRLLGQYYAGGLALAALLLGLAATLTVHSLLGGFVEREARLRFENDSRSVEQQIATRVRLYSDVLVTMRALMSADNEVKRSEFRDFVSGLDLPGRYPGFQTLNCAFYLRDTDLDAFVARQRIDPALQSAGVEFTVHPRAQRAMHEILTYVEPLDRNTASLGVDLDALPDRGNALQTLRDTGEAVSSGRLIYAERGAEYVGLAMRLPVYRRGMPTATVDERRRAYVGSVGAGIRVNDMMAGLLSAETLLALRYRIYDAGSVYGRQVEPSNSRMLYDSVGGVSVSSAAAASGGETHVDSERRNGNGGRRAAVRGASTSPPFTRSTMQQFAGRRWVIVFSAQPAALMGSQRYLPNVALLSGLVISLLLASLAYALSSSRSRALKVAADMTAGLRESERARAEAQRIAHLGDWRVNLGNGAAHVSNEMARLVGLRRGSPTVKMLARAIECVDRPALLSHLKRTLETREPFELECRYRSLRGRRGWLRIIGHACGEPGSGWLRGTALEVTKQKSIDRARELEHAFTLQLATATNDTDVFAGLVTLLTSGMNWDAGGFWPTQGGRQQLLHPVYSTSVAALEQRLRAQSLKPLIDDAPIAPRWSTSRATSPRLPASGIVTTFSFPLHTGKELLGVAEFYSRERRHVEPQALAMASSIASQMSHFLQRRMAECNLQFLANHDALTGLPNRLMFKSHLEDSLSRAHAEKTALHVLFIDLDRFKDINDSLGHNIGDQMLRAVAERLGERVPEANMIARLGGDEFIVLLEDRGDGAAHLRQTIDVIQAALADPFSVCGMQLQASASIGVSSFPEDGSDAQTLLKNADLAMYGAKQRGKNTFQRYARQMSMSLQQRVEMESCLRQAVENHEFTLFYQPRVDLRTNHCTGAEALIRWNSPKLGLVMPADFIPLAEETGDIVSIGAWVLREACRQAAEWRAGGLGDIHVAVNLSARQFADTRLRETILEALEDARLPGHLLELELTESVIMRHPEQAVHLLSAIKKTGGRLSIDDFGTGYSSLAYLNRFPIDIVKIDRSFIRHLPESHSDAQITSAVIALGHSLGLTVIAEGAETQSHIDFLRKEGCDEVQGYFFSRPLSAGDMRIFLDRPVQPGRGAASLPHCTDVRGSGSGHSIHS